MIVIVVNRATGEELLRERGWEGEFPRVGDIMELHCGETRRWRVDEVDWVFADAPAESHDDVPLKCLTVKASPFDVATGRSADPICECGHRESIHSPNGCTGRSHTCECSSFKEKAPA
ncbi:MAG: hypothetical protein H0W86_04385 [Armatimonadetes bacterium]|nr:hypothetical protein [Armatimonadota bacterium]